jgi:hypothetical protein
MRQSVFWVNVPIGDYTPFALSQIHRSVNAMLNVLRPQCGIIRIEDVQKVRFPLQNMTSVMACVEYDIQPKEA